MPVLKSLHLNNQTWEVKLLGENVFLLEQPKKINIEAIHALALQIEKKLGKHLNDMVIAYQSITLFTPLDLKELVSFLCDLSGSVPVKNKTNKVIELPICYAYGTDLRHIASHTGLTTKKIIQIHQKGIYRCVMIGFMPGFVYADGLDSRLYCPRKKIPDKYIKGGSVGIFGNQTGIYPSDSPGGWHVIGRTPIRPFDPQKHPPNYIPLLAYFKFYPISLENFKQWGK